MSIRKLVQISFERNFYWKETSRFSVLRNMYGLHYKKLDQLQLE